MCCGIEESALLNVGRLSLTVLHELPGSQAPWTSAQHLLTFLPDFRSLGLSCVTFSPGSFEPFPPPLALSSFSLGVSEHSLG